MTVGKVLKRSDISVGMEVTVRELDGIFGYYIILEDVCLEKNKFGEGTFKGRISEISESPIRLKRANSTLVYNDPIEAEELFAYE